ncbi:Proteasome subunit beta type-2 [Aphelenchoides besseyi]|nr:Proteasome subunit beta type-2 [Aphelenchoides besseyi]
MSGINFLIGYRTDKFVILCSDKTAFKYGALKVSNDASKEYQLGSHMTMTVIGESGDADNFGDWAKRNIYLYKLRHNYELSPYSAYHWLRKSIAENLRSEDFWRVDLLLGGFDTIEKTAFLGSVDYLGNGIPDQNYLFRGFGGRFGYAIMDSLYKKDATVEEALEIVKACVRECNKRFIANLPKFSVLVVDENGTHHLDDLESVA